MSPITYVEHGEGDCGAWPEMIMVGWSDGVLEALDPRTGDTYWESKNRSCNLGDYRLIIDRFRPTHSPDKEGGSRIIVFLQVLIYLILRQALVGETE